MMTTTTPLTIKANVDVTAPELLDNRRVVTRGKGSSASIIETITFTAVLQL